MDNDSKLRLLYIGKMLQNTDEAHPLTNAEMMQLLKDKYGMTTHRTTIPWVFGFGGKVKIKSPVEVKEQYNEMVKKAAEGLD